MQLKIDDLKLRLGDFSLECSLNLPSGQLITLLGPSGCGKTSLLKSLAGLYPLDGGTLHLGDREITRTDPRDRKVGMVFQDYALFPHMSVEKNIAYGMSLKGEAGKARCRELLSLVELEGFGDRRPEQLSGGEKQRVALARALATEPELLLLDEPLSALDARLRRLLRRQIRDIQKKTGITTVYVTHDQEEAMAISDTVVLMKGGRVVQSGSPEELYRTPRAAFTGDFFGLANMIDLAEAPEWMGSVPLEGLKRSGSGAKDYLFFRPEDCELKTSPHGEMPLPGGSGTLIYMEFGGDFHYLELDCQGTLIKSKCAVLPENLKEGDTLHWSVPAESCLILS